MEVELEMLKGSVMALVVAANTSAEGDTYRELSDAMLQVRPGHQHTPPGCCHMHVSATCCLPWYARECGILISSDKCLKHMSVTLWSTCCVVCAVLVLQLINWILALADGNSAGAPGQGFKQAGFESFERIWTGQQVGVMEPCCSAAQGCAMPTQQRY